MKSMKVFMSLFCWGLLGVPLTAAAQQASMQKALDCVMEPRSTIEIGSAEEGILQEVLVGRGDLVKKGDLLARLDMGLERLTAELAKLNAESDVEIRSGVAQLAFRRKETKRFDELLAKNAVPATEFDKVNMEAKLAQLSVEGAKKKREIASVEHRRAQEHLKRRAIRSPVDGIVVDVALSPGEYVHEQAPLMTIAQADPLHVEVFVPVAYFGQIAKGMRAQVIPEEPIGGSYEAEVTVVDQVFDPASRTFGVRLALPNREYRLPAGLRCQVTFANQAEVVKR